MPSLARKPVGRLSGLLQQLRVTHHSFALGAQTHVRSFAASSSDHSPFPANAHHLCPKRWCSILAVGIAPPTDARNYPSHQQQHPATTPSATPPSGLAVAVQKVEDLHTTLLHGYMNLLLDRRSLYRDQLLEATMQPLQKELRALVQSLFQEAGVRLSVDNSLSSLSSSDLRAAKEVWMRLRGVSASTLSDNAGRTSCFAHLRAFYVTLLSSGTLTREADLRLLLEELQRTDLLEPDTTFYESLLLSLWTLKEVQHSPVAATVGSCQGPSDGSHPSSSPSIEMVAGEARHLHRGIVGDLASHYMGHALAQMVPRSGSSASSHVAVRRETWEVFFCTLANAQPAPTLLELWWQRFLEWMDTEESAAVTGLTRAEKVTSTGIDMGIKDSTTNTPTTVKKPLPFQVAHALLAWCAQSRDMERALKFFNAVNQRGVTLHDATSNFPDLPSSVLKSLAQPVSLTSMSTHASVQEMQLVLLVKLMASTKSVKLDGGLRALVVRDVQRQIAPEVLYTAPWGVLNDLISGLSVTSGMQLLRRCSTADGSGGGNGGNAESHTGPETPKGETRPPSKSGEREIPFFIWASLLRRCCREHLQDQAESLFLFIRRKFSLTTLEKRELLEIMMRMFVTMQPADFPSALDLFLQHVLRTPPNDPVVQLDGVLYELLIKGADSRNASMMLLLEACASGVQLTPDLFEALMGSSQLKTIASLSRKLPHDYGASSLDAQLKVPADADAHLRREEALRSRGKPLYDSTGDAL